MFTPEQVRAYQSLEVQYPYHLPPRKLTDPLGLSGLYFVIGEVEDMDCGGECGQEHVEYVVIEPIGAEILDSPLSGKPFVTNTFGESMVLGGFAMTNPEVESVEVEDWPVQDATVESDPWLGQDF
jgi:hypothetical protein